MGQVRDRELEGEVRSGDVMNDVIWWSCDALMVLPACRSMQCCEIEKEQTMLR